jgi:parallel beta-helix repeat protein
MAGSASPTVQTTVIANCTYGVYLAASGAAGPQPIVSPGNQLISHSSYSVFTGGGSYPANSHVLLNFTSNWWGATDASIISNTIYDFTDSPTSTTLPSVNFGSMLDGPGGAPLAGNYVLGALTPASTTFTAGSTYDVLGILLVPSGKALTVEAGATLRFHTTQTRILVDGTLAIQGTAASPVRLTSGLLDPVKGSWSGIEVRATATNVVIDYAIIEWAVRALSVTNTNATISNSIIRNFSDTGIWMTGASSASQIANNYIDNFDSTGYGIYLTASSPAIANNQIHRTSVGIYAIGASNPAITGNAITNNGRGIVLDGNGSNSAAAVPNPVITGNDIFDNVNGQIEIYRYGASNPVVINAMDNWWGTATPVVGQQIRFTSGSPTSTLNHSNPSNTPRTRPVSGNITVSVLYFSPNGDGVRDTTAIAGSLNQSASWTVTVRNAAHSAVRTYSGSGAAIAATWDGRNAGGNVQPDGVYTFEVSASGPSGSGIVGSRAATLDNTPPATVITAPTASTTLTNIVSVPVTGSAADAYLVNFILQYGVGATPTTWTTLNSQNTTGITNGLLGNWVVSSTTGTGSLLNGPYVLRLSTSDKAGNVGLVQIPVALDLLSITAVTQSRQLMKPLAGEQLQVNFTLGAPASVVMQIYPEAGGALLWQTSENYSSGGAKSLTWNGRTTAGAYVGDDAYSYVLQASDGARSAAYDPPAPNNVGSGTGTVDAAFNANKNDFWKMNYQMDHFGRVRMQVSGCTTPTHFPYNWTPFPPGIHPLIWDGRGADGQLVSGACNIYFDAPLLMKPNTVVVRGTSPIISGIGLSPNIEVKSNPYRITHSYEQFSKVTYRIDQDAYVTVKLLPPGVSDPASPAAIVLTSNELRQAQSGGQPVNHEFEWKGYEALDTNDILVSAEGSYTFAIQATSVGSGATALYRGVLQLMQ